MICVTSGEERYAALFDAAGWKLVRTHYPRSKMVGVVEATKS
jgi:hypothetical protein